MCSADVVSTELTLSPACLLRTLITLWMFQQCHQLGQDFSQCCWWSVCEKDKERERQRQQNKERRTQLTQNNVLETILCFVKNVVSLCYESRDKYCSGQNSTCEQGIHRPTDAFHWRLYTVYVYIYLNHQQMVIWWTCLLAPWGWFYLFIKESAGFIDLV